MRGENIKLFSKKHTLASLDRLFSASDDSRNYFRGSFPEFRESFETAHLEVNDSGFLSAPSTDDVLRIVSCTYIVPLKRIELLLEGIASTAQLRPEQEFVGHHFGDGKERAVLQKSVSTRFSPNAKSYFPGYVPN